MSPETKLRNESFRKMIHETFPGYICSQVHIHRGGGGREGCTLLVGNPKGRPKNRQTRWTQSTRRHRVTLMGGPGRTKRGWRDVLLVRGDSRLWTDVKGQTDCRLVKAIDLPGLSVHLIYLVRRGPYLPSIMRKVYVAAVSCAPCVCTCM